MENTPDALQMKAKTQHSSSVNTNPSKESKITKGYVDMTHLKELGLGPVWQNVYDKHYNIK